MRRRREACRQRALRECLEVGNAGVAPPLRFLFLDGEERTHLREPLGVHVFAETGPREAHLPNYLDAVAVAIHQLVPQDAARRGPVIPRQMMEPEEELL